MIIDLKKIILEKNILPQGVIHIGAHKGQELNHYEECGFKKIIMIEANPEIFPILDSISSQICELKKFNVAIGDKKNFMDFNITHDNIGGGEMSSSLLNLKKHTELYPNITLKKTIKVQTITLDELLEENGVDASDYNLLNMDIQGAELLALKGATNVLNNIDIINTEVNKSELYENCALIDDLESFLNEKGFYKYQEDFRYSSEWGDAIFLKK